MLNLLTYFYVVVGPECWGFHNSYSIGLFDGQGILGKGESQPVCIYTVTPVILIYFLIFFKRLTTLKSNSFSFNRKSNEKLDEKSTVHYVKKDDTLIGLAFKYGVEVNTT